MFRLLKHRRVTTLAALASLCITAATPAAITLPAVFADHLVLQRDAAVPIWGTAAPGSAISVTFGAKTAAATADDKGKWKAFLPATPANASPADLVISGDGDPLTLHDVVVGDVWFCSGQSNMGNALEKADGGAEAIAGSADSLLREFDVAVDGTPKPADDVKGEWKSASPQTAGGFSAVAYFFADRLRHDLGVPIGIVHASLGGTPIEAWSRRGSLDGVGFMKPILKASDAKIAAATQPYSDLTRKSTPGWLFNGAIAPLGGLGVRGIVWYQGESNVDNAEQYKALFPRLINDWRAQWLAAQVDQATTKPSGHAPLLPFLFVQLAARDSADEPFGSPTADLRLAQAMALETDRTAMAVAIDTRAADWHPGDKKTVGERLADQALRLVYDRQRVEIMGPIWVSKKFRDDGTAVVKFMNADGMYSVDGPPSGFALAGDDCRFVPAEATIVKDTIELRAPGVDHPVAIRYGWSRGPHCNLYSAAGLPAAPFRTDDWPTPTTKPVQRK